MKIQGLVKLEFRDVHTGEITKTIEAENTICDWFMETGMIVYPSSSSTNYGMLGSKVFLSAYDIPATTPTTKTIPLIHPLGFVESGVTSPRFTEATSLTDHAFGEFQYRFAAPASLITINIIGLTYSNIDTNTNTIPASAYVKLASPCTQDTDETLDVFYRVVFHHDFYKTIAVSDHYTSQINDSMTSAIGNRYIITRSHPEFFTGSSCKYNGNVDMTNVFNTVGLAAGHDGAGRLPLKIGTSDAVLHMTSFQSITTIADVPGMIVGNIAYGDTSVDEYAPFVRPVTHLLGSNVVQSVFGHGISSTLPFFDSTQQNTGDGTMAINGDSWTNPDFPKQYFLDINTTGVVGVSNYKFKVRNTFGFVNNTYNNAIRSLSSCDPWNTDHHDGFVFGTLLNAAEDLINARPTFIRYVTFGTVLAVRKTALYVLNLQSETGTLFNVTNFASFNPTSITQVTFDATGTIYVGCRDSGIYKIVDPLGTPVVTLIDNTTTGLTGLGVSKCYGVVVGNSRLWAVFDGGLFSSADDGVTWVAATFTNAIITADWTLVKFIQADPAHADQRLALVYDSNLLDATTLMELSVLWWDETSATDVAGLQFAAIYRAASVAAAIMILKHWISEEPWTYFNWLSPSPTQNKWGVCIEPPGSGRQAQQNIGYPTFLTFGTTGELQTATTEYRTYSIGIDWELDTLSDQCIVFWNHFTDSTVQRMALYKDDNTKIQNQGFGGITTLEGDRDAFWDGHVCYLGKCVHFAWDRRHYYLSSQGQHDDSSGGSLAHLLYDNYGWNGSSWELNHVGTKSTHLSTDVLHDGLTISFDDASATQTFVATDYYNFGVLEGVWLDGATELDHNTNLYFHANSAVQTSLSASVLPSAVSSHEMFAPLDNVFAWQDISKVQNSGTTIYVNSATVLFDAGLRSPESITIGGVTDKNVNDTIYGAFGFAMYTDLDVIGNQVAVGLSPPSVLGTAINVNTIHYGFKISALGSGVGSGQLAQVDIIEQGVTVASNVAIVDTQYVTSYQFIIEYGVNDEMIFKITTFHSNTPDPLVTAIDTDVIVWTSTGVPVSAYHVDVALNGATVSAGFNVTNVNSGGFKTYYPDDYFVEIGLLVQLDGRHTNKYFAIDYAEDFEVLIDGIAAVQLATSDLDTTLTTGQISVFGREGFIRYSAADQGKTISASYKTLTRE